MDRFRIAANPKLDLVLERTIDVPPALVWKAWTVPEHLKPWFCPKPWQTVDCEIDLRPGGIFRTVMRSPEGQEFPNVGCYLEVTPNQRLIWTDALLPAYRPNPQSTLGAGVTMTAVLELEPHGSGTKYRAMALHPDEGSRQRHEEMGFHEGWSTVLDQLIDYIKALG